MKIGILGSGSVGKAIGAGFAALGHDVKMGSREPDRDDVKEWRKGAGGKTSSGTFAEAAAHAQLAVLATAWSGTENAIKLAKPENLVGKVVIDTTNPLDFSVPGRPPVLAVAGGDSAGENVQRWLPQARVVKAFNIVGNPDMFRPSYPGGPPTMFIAGNDDGAKNEVRQVLEAFGWPDTVDLGGIENARYLEPLAMVWIVNYFRSGKGGSAFKLIRK
ncbi:MAG TPA: NAD(P)-binding domain-containing protein [Candidatus Binatia bacterium]|nr:NAD(P)-binding domain-containing protein [Candidatus Binatia bacterium]